MTKANWKVIKIEQIAANRKHALAMGPFGSRITKDNFVDVGVPVIRGTNISNGCFDHRDLVFITEDKADELVASNAFADDLVFTHRGTLGQVGIIPEGHYPRYVVSQSQMKLTCDRAKVVPMFLYYYFKSELGRHELLSHAGGSGVPAISSPLTTLRNVKIHLPPLPIQRTIAGILSTYNNLIENNTRRIAVLEEIAQSLYQEWFVKFRFPGHENAKMVKSELGMIPQGWETVELRDVTLMINRGISPKYDTTSDNLVINQKCIRNKKLNLDEARRHLTKFPDQKLVQFGDVLINSTGVGTLGRVTQIYQVISDCTVDSHVTIVRPNKSIDIDFFGLQLLQQQSYFEGLGVGATGQTELGRETIAKTLFLQPPRKLQENFGAIVSPMRKSVIQLIERNANLCRTRDLLLPKLISGELDVSHWVDGDPGEIEVQEVMAKHTANKQLERAEPIDTKSLVWHSLWE